MKRLAIAVAILAVGVAGCGDGNGNPNNPSDISIFTVQLSALNEVPPVTNAESTARGTAVITINKATNTVSFSVSFNGFTPTSAINLAHIHPGAAGTNGSPLVNTGLTAGQATLTNGAGTLTFDSVTTSAANITSILANPQNFYFNVHTSLNPGGALRGQLQ